MCIFVYGCALSQPQFSECDQDCDYTDPKTAVQYIQPEVSNLPEDASLAMADYLTKNGHYEITNGSCYVDKSDVSSITVSCWKTHLPKRIELSNYGWNGYAKLTNTEMSVSFQIQTYQYISYSNISMQQQPDTTEQIAPYSTVSYNTPTYSNNYSYSGDVYVKGHYRHYKSGKISYVKPHYRSRPRR